MVLKRGEIESRLWRIFGSEPNQSRFWRGHLEVSGLWRGYLEVSRIRADFGEDIWKLADFGGYLEVSRIRAD